MRPKRHHTEIFRNDDETYFRDSGPDWIEMKTASIKNGRERERKNGDEEEEDDDDETRNVFVDAALSLEKK